VPALARPVLPTRYREGDGLALTGEVGGAAEVVASAGAGMHHTTTAGGKINSVF
jgi:hypothetical protein